MDSLSPEQLNHLDEIADLRTEQVANQKDPHFDYLFKVITIGDPGKFIKV